MSLSPGQMVGSQLRLVEPLDGGGMGRVWVADHLTLRIRVAVKFIDESLLSNDPKVVDRFRHEASASARIKSPHVVQVLDHAFTDQGVPYIVMELLEGETLGERLSRGPLDLETAAQVVVQVASALHRAHRVGVVHRDIKPDNVFLSRIDDEIFCKVFDFGIAKQVQLPELDGLTSPGRLIGTPEFMSPELFSKKRAVDHYADLWALAAMTFYALSLELPFAGEDLAELCTNLLLNEPRAITSLRPDLPSDLDDWFRVALAKAPADRFQDARTLARSFVEAIGSRFAPLFSAGTPSRLSFPDLSLEARAAWQLLGVTGSSAPPSSVRPRESSLPPSSQTHAFSQPAPRSDRARLVWAGVGLLAVATAGGASLLLGSVTSRAEAGVAGATETAAREASRTNAAGRSSVPEATASGSHTASAPSSAPASGSAAAEKDGGGEAPSAAPGPSSSPPRPPSSEHNWGF